MYVLKRFWLLLCLLPVAFLVCTDNPANQSVEKGDVSISLVAAPNSGFSAAASTAEVKVSADGMPTLTQSLTVTAGGISGTITGIIAGPDRKFEVYVYDASNKLSYYGSAIGEVTVGGTANISLTLYKTSGEGNAVINGTIQPSNIPPTVSITSPANNAQFSLGSAIALAATAADADGSVGSVAFYSGTTLLSTDNTSPYSYSYTPSAAGAYTLSAVATDNAGASTNSAVVTVTVAAVNQTSYKINCGGTAVSPFAADGYYSGGSTSSTTSAIAITGITNPAPAAVYQKERYGAVTYTFPSLVSGASYNTRLHFAEIYWTASAKRRFNVAINSSQVLTNFDIYATAGAAKKAVVREFTATANSSGQIVVKLTNVTDNATICGIEILPVATPPVISGPASQSTCQGVPAALSVSASGGSAFTYQWYTGAAGSGTAISGATSATYSTASAGSYYCVVTNNSGLSATSSAATVTVSAAPVITTQPVSQSAALGTFGGFTVEPQGDYLNDYTYQWYFNSQIVTSSPAAPYIQGTGTGYMIYVQSNPAVVGNWHCIVTAKSTGCTIQTNTVTFSVDQTLVITSQPSSVAICAGASSMFGVTASGGTGLTYQWYTGSGSAISGATSSMYATFTAGSYYCRVSNSQGSSVNSNTATLTINPVPVITQQPQSGSAPLGSWGGFTIDMSGDRLNDYTYQWYFNGQIVTSSPASDYIQGNGTGYMIYVQAAPATTGNWYCVVTAKSTGCTIQTNTVTYSVDQTLVITTQPSSVSICAGASGMFGVTASGGTGLTYQWYTGSGSAISGATSAMYATSTAGSYYCRVSNSQGSSVNSSTATLTINLIPVITQQPVSGGANQGSNGGFTVEMSGNTSDYTYQWYFNGQIASSVVSGYIGGDTGYMIYIMADPATTGNWYCVVTAKSTGCTIQTNTVTYSVVP
jgi:beta-galactosidase